MNKYGARKAEVDGYRFASRAERARYWVLKQRQALGEISGLHVHPSWPLVVNGQQVGRYTTDFAYLEPGAGTVVEDVKSRPTRTEAYRLRKKLMAALYGVEIREILA